MRSSQKVVDYQLSVFKRCSDHNSLSKFAKVSEAGDGDSVVAQTLPSAIISKGIRIKDLISGNLEGKEELRARKADPLT
ncbi:MAG: hypothetical protein H7222_11285 [Methylotenera sp.]|nr:hypothetical protein [Oligoflexia bacterium]